MEFETIIVEKKDNIVIITLNRPDRLNALNTQLLEDLNRAINEAECDENIGVMIITGKGKAFCAGADIAEVETFSSPSTATNFLHKAHLTFTRLERMSKPVIARVNGAALGGGCELALACDLRIASEVAIFGVPEIKIGVIPGGGGTQRLPRTVGITKAMEMLLTGDPITADEAYRIGLVNKVIPQDSVVAETEKLASILNERPPLAIKMVKVATLTGLNVDLDSGLVIELQCSNILFNSEDCKEGMKAFVEKRKPQFRGI